MNRRSTLTTLLGKSTKTDAQHLVRNRTAKGTYFTFSSGLDPYAGTWGYEQAAHLLRRAMFGPTYAQIKQAAADGLEATVAKLLAAKPLPAPPLNPDYQDDPYVPVGSTWIYKGYVRNAANNGNIQNYRRRSLRAWTIEQLWKEGVHAREKMTLFWHNHFATNTLDEPLYEYWYINNCRLNAFGNFKDLVKKMTIDPGMLYFLNGNQNTKNAPNENYARELFELFAIGKGPLAGPGDYTHYTEEDIKQAAKVLTGWIIQLVDNGDGGVQAKGVYVNSRHDTGTKTLSHRFNNARISNMAENEYAHLIDIIFQQPECARFICRKLYRWFVYYEINEQIESEVIEPMAQLLIANNYNMLPVLHTLFKSQHFFDVLNYGPMIKNPIDFVMTPFKVFELPLPTTTVEKYNFTYLLFSGRLGNVSRQLFTEMQMVYFSPPDVAGWKSYYQEPSFYRIWINSVTLPVRMFFTTLVSLGVDNRGRKVPQALDVLAFVSKLDNPYDPNALIDEFVKILFPQPITQNQKDYLKQALLPGLPDYEWSIEYGDFVENPDDKNLRTAVESKLRNLLNVMLSMPEFYLS